MCVQRGSQEVLASSGAQFRITDANSDADLYFIGSARQTASPAVAAYIRGLASLAQKDEAGRGGFLPPGL